MMRVAVQESDICGAWSVADSCKNSPDPGPPPDSGPDTLPWAGPGDWCSDCSVTFYNPRNLRPSKNERIKDWLIDIVSACHWLNMAQLEHQCVLNILNILCIRFHLEYLIVIMIWTLDERIMNYWRWRFWGVDCAYCACSGGCVIGSLIVEVNGVFWWFLWIVVVELWRSCVCVRLHHAAWARCSCGWLFEEAGTVQHQQPPVSDDWFARRDRQRPAAQTSIHPAATRDTPPW